MIHVSHLTKKYGRTTAVDDISFEVQQGEIVGYLGPNGAGKSTTLKMLVGLLQPTSGEISVAGYSAETELLELKQRIGYVPEEAQLYEHLTLVEHLQLMGVVFAQDEVLSLKFFYESYVIGLSPGFSVIFCFIGTSFVGCFLLPIRYSEHWKASWMLKLPPLSAPRDVWRGVQATTLLYIAVPFTILMSCIATFIWGILGVFYALPGFMSLLYYILLYPKPHSRLPLSEEFIQKQMASKSWIPLLCSGLVVIVFVGGLSLAYLLSIWVYFGVYCVMVVGGLIGFIYYFRKNSSN